MAEWMTVRVVLQGNPGVPLVHPPGRVLLVDGDHTFNDLAEAVNTAFARWDLTPSHEFEVEGRLLCSADAPLDDTAEVEDSADVTVGEVGLRRGAPFVYRFDPGEEWIHQCTVEEVDVDPFTVVGGEPDAPLPVFGWGAIPDQYGRMSEDDDEGADVVPLVDARVEEELDFYDEEIDDEEIEAEIASWREGEATAWAVVAEALGDVALEPAADELARATARLRDGGGRDRDALLTIGGLNDAALPEDDEELWLEAAAGVISPREEPPFDVETVAAWATLEPADWAGAVIELVRAGPGQAADPASLLELVDRCPEVEGEELSEDDVEVVLAGFATVVALWRELGVLDREDRLTALGSWGLPGALRRAWVR